MRTLRPAAPRSRSAPPTRSRRRTTSAASLVTDYGSHVFAIKRGEDHETYYKHIDQALEIRPTSRWTTAPTSSRRSTRSREDPSGDVIGGTEETTTGVIRLRAMANEGALRYPIIAVNDAQTKHLFDNRYGTGQSTIDGILRATNTLLAGKNFVVVGYGWCGRGVASRARGMGANTIVVEIDPLRGARGGDGRLSRDADRGGRARGRHLRHASPATTT